MKSVSKAFVGALTGALLLGGVGAAAADEKKINMVGTWTGKTHSIVAGTGAHFPDSKGTFDSPALFEKDVKMVVTGQQDRRFWGKTAIGSGAAVTEEPFVGAIDTDGKTLAIADTDGYLFAHIHDKNKIAFCYVQAGGKGPTPAVVSCATLKREKEKKK